jgi:YbbR domain-containing protein
MLGFITRNWRLKLAAVVLAVVAWVGVVYAANPPGVRSVTVPVPQPPAVTLPAGYIITQPIPELTVSVAGTQNDLNAFNRSSITMSVDYAAISSIGNRVPATVDVPITLHNSDPSVQLSNPPRSVPVQVDRTGTQTAAVSVVVGTNLPAGYREGTVATSPAQVTLTGAEHQLRSAVVRTLPIDLGNQRGNFDETLKVYPYTASGQPLSSVINVTPASVEVQIEVISVTTSRTSAVVLGPLRGLGAGEAVTSIGYAPTTVTLTGSQDLINAASLDQVVTAAIDLSGQTGTRTYTVSVPSPATGITVSPSTVSVTITVAPIPTPTPGASPSPGPTG